MICEVHFSKRAKNQLNHFSKVEVIDILGWLVSNIQGCNDPKALAIPIKGENAEYLMYSVDKFNLYCVQDDDIVIVLSVEFNTTSSE